MATNQGHFSWADTLGWQQRKYREIEIIRWVHDMAPDEIAAECRHAGVTVGDRPVEDLRDALVDVFCARLR